MVLFCLVALIVFGVLGIFSAKYRALAKEAFECSIRTVTLRPCQTGFDQRMQATIVGSILPHSPKTAKALNRHFNLISTIFAILFFASMIYTGYALYNYWAYGNCNGPNSTAFCVFDAIAGGQHATVAALKPVAPGVGPTLGNGSITIVEFGCFTCPYTKAAQAPLMQFLAANPQVKLEFRAFPIQSHPYANLSAEAAFCAGNQSDFWPMYNALFATSNHTPQSLMAIAANLSLNTSEFAACLNSTWVSQRLEEDIQAGDAAGIYGTPTFFIGNQSLVGPSDEQDFQNLLAGQGQTPSEINASESCGPITK
jgi:protein-disulfide isomerase